MVQSFQQHAAGAAGGIIDSLPGFGGKDADHESDNRTRRVKLPGFLVGQVREFPDQVLVRLAEHIRLAVLVSQAQG